LHVIYNDIVQDTSERRAIATPPDDALSTAFRTLLTASAASARVEAHADLEAIPAQLAELSRRFVTLDRRLATAARRIQELGQPGEVSARADAELRALRALLGVAEIDVAGGLLRVSTTPIHLAWMGATYDLGRYWIELDLAGDVRIESIDKLGPKPAWDHPHVQDGLPCLGNLRQGVLKLIAEYELAIAVRILLDFLTTYQPEEAYTPIEGWPQVGERAERRTAAGPMGQQA
jgi:hypothetical protein